MAVNLTIRASGGATTQIALPDPVVTVPPVSSWPNASNTGVPAGTVLTNSGPMTITVPNTIIQNRNISGPVIVKANGVVIKNCRINGNRNGFAVDADGRNVTVQDSEIWNASNAAVLCQNGKVLRCNLHHCDNGVVTQGGDLVQDNYIHDLGFTADAHVDGVSIQAGSGQVVRHNHIESWDTSCVFIKSDFTAIHNVLVENNRLINTPGKKTAACVYADNSPRKGMSGITFRDNIMEKGNWFYASVVNTSVTWINNRDYLTGALIPQP